MSLLGLTVCRSSGVSYLQDIPAAEWVRRLEGLAPPATRGAVANIVDWDYFLHLPARHPVFKSKAYLQLQLWAAPYPAGMAEIKDLQDALEYVGWSKDDAERRAVGDWEKDQWNSFRNDE